MSTYIKVFHYFAQNLSQRGDHKISSVFQFRSNSSGNTVKYKLTKFPVGEQSDKLETRAKAETFPRVTLYPESFWFSKVTLDKLNPLRESLCFLFN